MFSHVYIQEMPLKTISLTKRFPLFSVTTRFCREWAKTMISDASDNPVFLRQVIENYKLRVSREWFKYWLTSGVSLQR